MTKSKGGATTKFLRNTGAGPQAQGVNIQQNLAIKRENEKRIAAMRIQRIVNIKKVLLAVCQQIRLKAWNDDRDTFLNYGQIDDMKASVPLFFNSIVTGQTDPTDEQIKKARNADLTQIDAWDLRLEILNHMVANLESGHMLKDIDFIDEMLDRENFIIQ